MIIASRDDINCTSAGPVEGKYLGWITLGAEDRFRPLLNTEPHYNSAEEAVAAMKALVEEIRTKESQPKCSECGGSGYGIYGQPGNTPCAACNS